MRPPASSETHTDGIRDRVIDAQLLWESGRIEGAFLLALIAVAAQARRAHPKPTGDRDAFGEFIRSHFRPRLSVEFRGRLYSLEDIFYKWMRCELVHDGGLPVDLQLMTGTETGELSLRAGGAPHYVLLISPAWFDQLIAWALS